MDYQIKLVLTRFLWCKEKLNLPFTSFQPLSSWFLPFSLIHSEDINFAVKSLSNYADSLEKATHKHNKKSLTEKRTPRYSLKPDGRIPCSLTLDVWTKFVLMCQNQMTEMNHCRVIVCMYCTSYLQSSELYC